VKETCPLRWSPNYRDHASLCYVVTLATGEDVVAPEDNDDCERAAGSKHSTAWLHPLLHTEKVVHEAHA
jgi:hypothetical protein